MLLAIDRDSDADSDAARRPDDRDMIWSRWYSLNLEYIHILAYGYSRRGAR